MPGPPTPNLVEPVKLLVRSVNWLGDAVMTTPAMQRLRKRLPKSRITLLTSAKLADLWVEYPGVDRVVTFGATESPWTIGRRLRREGFDAALVLPNSTRSALEVWWAAIPRRIGYVRNWRRCFLTQAVAYPEGRLRPHRRGIREIKRLISAENLATNAAEASYVHQMHDYLELASALGADSTPLPPRLEMSAEEVESATSGCLSKVEAEGNRDHPAPPPVWLGLNPAAAYGPAKCWPAERFSEVAREVSKRVPGAIWLCFGTTSDWQMCQRVVELGETQIINLAGKTSLRQLMAFLKKCLLLLTNDSGPMHVAAALGTPVVVPFGSTSPQLTGPGEPGDPRHHLLQSAAACSPCFRRTCPIDFRCMTGIASEGVIRTVLETLQVLRQR